MNAAYMECSSKEMTGVEEIFERAILTVVANDRKNLEAQAAAAAAGKSTGRPESGGRNGGGGGRGGADAVVIPGIAPLKKRKKRMCRAL